MDFSAIFQLRTKKFWWMDVIFYFVISLLIATIFCYVIFWVKNNIQREDIEKEAVALQTVGTEQQKEYEKTVVTYQNKINDFSNLLRNHEFASNVFAFMQAQTMPDVWFKQFSLDKKNSSVQLSGESNNMDAFSRQVAIFEKNEYVKSITTLNSSLGASARISFNINLILDQRIFDYISDASVASEADASSNQSPDQEGQATAPDQTALADQENPQTPPENENAETQNSPDQEQQVATEKSSEKLITFFHIPLNPEVIGIIDEVNHAITLDVPFGTDVKNLTPLIVMSPGATVLPAPRVSQDFEIPVTYIVTAEDGTIQNYVVKVVVGAPAEPVAEKKSSQSGYVILVIVALVVIVVLVVASLFLRFLRKRQKNAY